MSSKTNAIRQMEDDKEFQDYWRGLTEKHADHLDGHRFGTHDTNFQLVVYNAFLSGRILGMQKALETNYVA